MGRPWVPCHPTQSPHANNIMFTPTQLSEEPKGLKPDNAKTKFNGEQTKVETLQKPAKHFEAKNGTINPNTTVLHQNLIIGKVHAFEAATKDTAKIYELKKQKKHEDHGRPMLLPQQSIGLIKSGILSASRPPPPPPSSNFYVLNKVKTIKMQQASHCWG